MDAALNEYLSSVYYLPETVLETQNEADTHLSPTPELPVSGCLRKEKRQGASRKYLDKVVAGCGLMGEQQKLFQVSKPGSTIDNH